MNGAPNENMTPEDDKYVWLEAVKGASLPWSTMSEWECGI